MTNQMKQQISAQAVEDYTSMIISMWVTPHRKMSKALLALLGDEEYERSLRDLEEIEKICQNVRLLAGVLGEISMDEWMKYSQSINRLMVETANVTNEAYEAGLLDSEEYAAALKKVEAA